VSSYQDDIRSFKVDTEIRPRDLECWERAGSCETQNRIRYLVHALKFSETSPCEIISIRDYMGILQSFALLRHEPDFIKILFLASAPWNITPASDKRRMGGSGKACMREIAEKSLQYGKTITLQPVSTGFYRRIGFSGDSERMYWHPEAMRRFLESYGKI